MRFLIAVLFVTACFSGCGDDGDTILNEILPPICILPPGQCPDSEEDDAAVLAELPIEQIDDLNALWDTQEYGTDDLALEDYMVKWGYWHEVVTRASQAPIQIVE